MKEATHIIVLFRRDKRPLYVFAKFIRFSNKGDFVFERQIEGSSNLCTQYFSPEEEGKRFQKIEI